MPPSRLTRRGFVGAAAGAAALGATACSTSSSSGSSSSDSMNVLLLIVDSVRPDFVGCYGSPQVQTPNIDTLAGDGLRFNRFFPEAMPTVPARRTIFTGRRIFPFRGWERAPDLGRGPGAAPIEDVGTTFTSALRRAGYWTGSVSDNPFVAFTKSWRPFRLSFDRYVSVVGHSGFRGEPDDVTDEQLERWLPEGLSADDRYVEGMRKYLANTGSGEDDSESNAARVFGEAAKLLEEAEGNQPFALVVDSFDPHEPWSPTQEYIDLYASPSYDGPNPGTARYTRWESYLEEDELRQMRAVYSAALTITDKWLGEFLGQFRERGLHENTAIVFVSDHGILLGDRGWTGKIAQELHPELIQVPCVIVHPDRPRRGGDQPVVRLDARHRADAAVAGRGACAARDGRRRPVAAARRRGAGRAPLRLRRLLQPLLRAQRPLVLRRGQPRRPPRAVRPDARPGRGRERGRREPRRPRGAARAARSRRSAACRRTTRARP